MLQSLVGHRSQEGLPYGHPGNAQKVRLAETRKIGAAINFHKSIDGGRLLLSGVTLIHGNEGLLPLSWGTQQFGRFWFLSVVAGLFAVGLVGGVVRLSCSSCFSRRSVSHLVARPTRTAYCATDAVKRRPLVDSSSSSLSSTHPNVVVVVVAVVVLVVVESQS